MDFEPIHYRVGNEHDPMDPFGRVDLLISRAGEVQLTHVSRHGSHAWTAMVRPAVLDGLRAAIVASGFPVVPMGRPVPDSEMRQLAVGNASALVEPKAAKLQVYADIFATLDAMADEISGGTIRRHRLTDASMVTSIRPI